MTDGISLIKFCECFNDLNDFGLELQLEAANNIEDEIVDEGSDSSLTAMDERRPDDDVRLDKKRTHQILHHVVFVVKLDVVNSSALSPQETIRNVMRKTIASNSNIWSVAVIYVSDLFASGF